MNKIIENIKKQIPKYQSGFSFKKSQELFIPYLEIGIECLIRDISEINLFFETILKLIEIEIKDITEISQIMGISYDIAKEAIVDMVDGEYVSVSENTLRITKKGIEALKTKQLVEIKKKNINKVMIDLITGEIYDGNSIKCQRIRKHDICLDKQINVSKAFLDSNFSSINRVYQQQKESDSIFGRGQVNKELYKIIDISYENLLYLKNELFIYQDNNSEDIQLQLQNDVNDQYSNCLYTQLKEGTHPCLDYFFEKDFIFVKEHISISTNSNQNLLDVTDKLCTLLSHTENIDNTISELFMKERYMVTDKEYISYFAFSDEITFDKLIITTNRVKSILSPAIFNEIKRIATKKPVVLIYDNNEFSASRVINNYLAIEKAKHNIITFPSESITGTNIFFAPFLEINMEEKIINAFDKAIAYKFGKLRFNNGYGDENLKNVLTMYNIDELIHKQTSTNKANKNTKIKKQ